jgi:hypothetical protein
MAVARSGTCACPRFRPAIILSVLPLEPRSSRTFQAWPSDPGLTDKPQGGLPGHAEAVADLRQIAFKKACQIIIKITATEKDDRFAGAHWSHENGNVLGQVVMADSRHRFINCRGPLYEAIPAAPYPGVHKSGRCPDRIAEPLAPGQWTVVINGRRSGNCESTRHDDLIIVNSDPFTIR